MKSGNCRRRDQTSGPASTSLFQWTLQTIRLSPKAKPRFKIASAWSGRISVMISAHPHPAGAVPGWKRAIFSQRLVVGGSAAGRVMQDERCYALIVGLCAIRGKAHVYESLRQQCLELRRSLLRDWQARRTRERLRSVREVEIGVTDRPRPAGYRATWRQLLVGPRPRRSQESPMMEAAARGPSCLASPQDRGIHAACQTANSECLSQTSPAFPWIVRMTEWVRLPLHYFSPHASMGSEPSTTRF